MPPKVNFDRDEIIHAGIEVVRKLGPHAITTRNIAREMGGSTQPIYRVFETIETLEAAIIRKAEEEAIKVMVNYNEDNRHFLSIGLGYFHFALHEPHLFKLVYMSETKPLFFSKDNDLREQLLNKMKEDKDLQNFSDETLHNLLRDMSIFSHGICTAFLISKDERIKNEYKEMLINMGFKLITYEHLKLNNIINEDEIKRRIHNEHNNS